MPSQSSFSDHKRSAEQLLKNWERLLEDPPISLIESTMQMLQEIVDGRLVPR